MLALDLRKCRTRFLDDGNCLHQFLRRIRKRLPDEEVLKMMSLYNDPVNEPVYGDLDLWNVYFDEGKRRWGFNAALERLAAFDAAS